MTLTRGTRLGPYEILELVGAGGMGEVYRAHDPRIGRDVAIKILPAAYASDPDRLRRFELETRATGLLNHPNILTIYDTGRLEPGDIASSAPFIVTELLEGQTLRDELSSRPPFTAPGDRVRHPDCARARGGARAKGSSIAT